MPGQYTVSVLVSSSNELIEEIDSCMQMEITPRDLFGTGLLPKPKNAMYLPSATWQVQEPASLS